MRVLFFVLFTFLVGCASAPKTDFGKDFKARPEKVDVDDDVKEMHLSYLAKDMLDTTDRRQLITRVQDHYQQRKNESSSLAKNTTDFALASNYGTGVHQALAVASLGMGLADELMSKEGKEWVGAISLPEEYDGQLISSEDEAWNVAVKVGESQLKKVADKFKMTLECVAGCDEVSRLYVMTPTDLKVFDQYIYKPKGKIAVQTYWGKFRKVGLEGVLEEELRGFTPKWQSKGFLSWTTEFILEPEVDGEGKVVIRKAEHGNYFAHGKLSSHVAVGRDFMRIFYDDGGLAYFGSDAIYPGYFCFDGEVYGYILMNDTDFIDKKLVEQSKSVQ